jgi:Arylsulfotransferase (ASST)
MIRLFIAASAAWVAVCLTAPGAGALTVSPLPGAPDASPHTQISFLGVAAGEIRDVAVSGSRSGSHSGRLEPYSSEPGASFVPAREFDEGEQVRVSALVGPAHRARRVTDTFTVARLADYPFGPERPHLAPKPGTVQSFASEPGMHPPTVTVTTRAPGSSPQDLFIAPDSGYSQSGPMIFERDGALVWFKPLPTGESAMDLQVQHYEGQPVLVWWQGRIVSSLGVGFGVDEIYDSSYRPIATVGAGNGYRADLHEIQLTPSGAAYVTAYSLVRADLSSVGGSRDGTLQDAIVQEVDVRTGLVMWEWHAYGHVALSDSYKQPTSSATTPWDYFHVNSISPDPWGDGNLLVSSRNTWAAYEVDHHSGRIEWRLGGKRTSFRMGAGTGTAYQHDARWQPDGTITIFDDGATPKVHSQSRAIHERIDWHTRSVSLIGRYVRAPPLLTGSQGNDQVLPVAGGGGGGSFVGWGEQPYFTEFSSSGQTLFEAHIPYPGSSYRAYTYPWTGTPAAAPALAVTPSSGEATMVYASWNGATEVSSWRVLAGPNPAQLATIATAGRSGFQTSISVHSSQPDFAVQALGAAGEALGTSATLQR